MNSNPASPAILNGQAAAPIAAEAPPPSAQMQPEKVATLPEPVTSLWKVQQVAAYLQRSQRSIGKMLSTPATEPGSIPHVRLPGRAVRFVPDQVVTWVEDGCPPAATFAKWHKKRK